MAATIAFPTCTTNERKGHAANAYPTGNTAIVTNA